MKIEKTIETPEGAVSFRGELSQDELDLILSVGLNYLLQQGALPLKSVNVEDIASMAEGSEELQ